MDKKYVGRAGEKLEFALREFGISVQGKVCADFGSSVGGFVDCLIKHGAKKIYAAETGYGVLDWKLRNDERVVVLERTNAMHVKLPEKMDLITVDTSWTRQEKIIPNALKNLKEKGIIISLIKPHYESGKASLTVQEANQVTAKVVANLKKQAINVKRLIRSPLKGESGKNIEFLALIV